MRRQGYRAGLVAGAVGLAASLASAGAAEAQRAVVENNQQILVHEAGANAPVETIQIPSASGLTVAPITTHFDKGSQQTDASGNISYAGSAPGRTMSLGTQLQIQRQQAGEIGTTVIDGHNQLDMTDVITYRNTSTLPAPIDVIVSGQLLLTDEIDGGADSMAFHDNTFQTDGFLETVLQGNGLTLGAQNQPFFCAFGANESCVPTAHETPIDFSFRLSGGQSLGIDLQLIDSFRLALEDDTGAHVGLGLSMNGRSSLSVLAGSLHVTDLDGAAVCGAVITGVSGADWGSTAACPGGGGGGAPGGVPEPATWAVMILGLGSVGAALRRHRAALVTA